MRFPHLLELLKRLGATTGPQMDVREYTEVFPSALPAARRRSPSTRGCRSRRAATTLARSASCRSSGGRSAPARSATSWRRCRASPRAGVVEVTLLGQNVNTYGRDLTVPGSSSRAAVRRAPPGRSDGVDGIRRSDSLSPHPHDFTADVIDAMAESAAVCEHIHFPLQSGSDRVLQAMRRSYRRERYLGWLERIREAIPGVAVIDRHHRRVPRRDRGGLRGHAATWSSAARFDAAYTFQYSPRPGTRGRDVRRPGAQGGRAGAVRPAGRAAGADLARAQSARRSGGTVEVLVEGAGEGRTVDAGTHADQPLVHVPERRSSPGRSSHARDHGGAPHHLTGELVPSPEAVAAEAAGVTAPLLALVGPTASGKTEASLALAERSARRSCRSTRCSSTGGWTSARPSPHRPSGPRVPHHLIDVADPSEPFSVVRFQELAREAVADDRRARPSAAAGRRVRPLLPGGGRRARVPGDRPGDASASSRTRRTRWAPSGCTSGSRRRTRSRPRASSRRTCDEPCGPSRSPRSPGGRSRPSRRRGSATRRRAFAPRAWTAARGAADRGSSVRVRSMLAEGWLDEVRSLLERGFGGWLTSTQAIGYAEVARHLRGT